MWARDCRDPDSPSLSTYYLRPAQTQTPTISTPMHANTSTKLTRANLRQEPTPRTSYRISSITWILIRQFITAVTSVWTRYRDHAKWKTWWRSNSAKGISFPIHRLCWCIKWARKLFSVSISCNQQRLSLILNLLIRTLSRSQSGNRTTTGAEGVLAKTWVE